MGYVLRFDDIRRVMRTLGMRPREGHFKVEVWKGHGINGQFARVTLHPHPKPLATGTASSIAKSLGFEDVAALCAFLRDNC